MIIEVIDKKKMENGKIMVNLWNGALWGNRVNFIVTQLKFSDPYEYMKKVEKRKIMYIRARVVSFLHTGYDHHL